ncbi:MAG TPA: hypothetical protein VJL35_10410 [Gemmatimonadaceae bacterium]|nr:hypothetical protein [Gemmatimonadaceae bacterium]
MEVVMELFGVPATPDAQAGGTERAEDVLNLGAWFQKGWTTAGSIGERSADFVAGIFDRFREADALAYDNEGENSEN